VANATAEDNQLDTTLRPGQILDGKYRVDYLVGRGGMAAVWAGTNERTGKRVALKMLLQSLARTSAAAELFRREGLAASRIDHPNVVTIFDVIEHQGMACIVMELLTGESLDRHLARVGTLTLNEALSLIFPAMRGVSAAHAYGVIHRDLKPQNIFICVGPDGRPVTTKVLDFGISLIVERALDPAAGFLLGVAMGTPAYMAPDQVAASEDIDARADVYGFGVLLYEALSGRVPFVGDPGPQLYDAILNEAPPPLGQLRPDLPSGIARIVDTALAKEPAQRHPSLDVMIAAIEDEIMPATPVPRTPAFGIGAVPTEAAHDGRVTPSQAMSRYESTGEHRATKFLVGFPLQAEPAGRRPNSSHPMVGPGSQASAPTIRLPSPLRRGMVAAGLAGLVAGLGLLVWLLTWGKVVPENVVPAARRPAPVLQPPPVIVPLTPSPGPSSAPLAPSRAAAFPESPAADEDAVRPPKRNPRSRGAPGSARVKLRPSLGAAKPRAGTLSIEEF
jgi:serine/threonine protein kinase